jgi:hypothetical protein
MLVDACDQKEKRGDRFLNRTIMEAGDHLNGCSQMRNKLLQLENLSRCLEPGIDERESTRKKVIEYSEDFLENIEALNAFNISDDKGIGLLESPITEDGIGIDEALKLIRENVDTPGLNPASGGHLAYIPGGGIYYSALGDYLADVFNRYAGVFYASPGAVRMENMLIRWMNELVGYPANASGNLTSGGSLANLIAIVTARDAQNIKAKDIERSVLYISEQAHHSVDKAIRIAGLSECVIRHIPLDDRYRMIAGELDGQILKDRGEGLNPFLIVASAGTTDVVRSIRFRRSAISRKKTDCGITSMRHTAVSLC